MSFTAAAKHILNDPETSIAKRQVTIISGGGSGHEPGYAGYVGDGMLTAAVCGHVFASPSASQVLAAIERVQSPHGTLVIVMNYTGDCLNFGLAIERAKARGIRVAMVVFGDDVAVGRKSKIGRRGVAGTVLAVKAAGALARGGASLEEIIKTIKDMNEATASLGVALDHCHVPGSSAKEEHLPDKTIEIGMGIHNEAGFQKTDIMPARALVGKMIDMLVDVSDPERGYIHPSPVKPLVVLINNLGGISPIELNLIVKEAVDLLLQKHHFSIARVLAGSFLTSLNMPGFSITLLILEDRSWIELINQSVDAPGWLSTMPRSSFSANIACSEERETLRKNDMNVADDGDGQDLCVLKKAICSACQSVIEAEPQVTEFDTKLGDGDCGTTLKTAASAILQDIPQMIPQSCRKTIMGLADIIERSVGGTSSAIYCIYLNALGGALPKEEKGISIRTWSQAAKNALDALETYTPAREGDRTLMDVLIPFVNTLHASHNFSEAVEAARRGAEKTRCMKAHMGRASYLSADDVKSAAIPDAGAWGLKALLEGLSQGLE
ncbi:dihydroxyacetone kinase [Dichotomocladium elegans]|nr:dihydroxyacetone kinase [Dichotomocladium elegans]